jgi:hypothetical protein
VTLWLGICRQRSFNFISSYQDALIYYLHPEELFVIFRPVSLP